MGTVPAPSAASTPPLEYDKEAGAQLAVMLTRLALAFPRQRLSEAEHEERTVMYVETLTPRWRLDVIEDSLREGLTRWKWFPTIAEIEELCQAANARRWAISNPPPRLVAAGIDASQAAAIEDKRTPEEREAVARGLADLRKRLANDMTVLRRRAAPADRDRATADDHRESIKRVRAERRERIPIPGAAPAADASSE